MTGTRQAATDHPAHARGVANDLDERRDYHGRELEIARSGRIPGSRPEVPVGARVVLDVGCGAGQTLAALDAPPETLLIGVDHELSTFEALKVPDARFRLVGAAGEALPVASSSCDMVICRVALPYMDVRIALAEMARVLRAGGALWITLHPVRMIWAKLLDDVRHLRWRSTVYQCFILVNGVLLATTGRQLTFPFGRDRRETFQTAGGMRRALRRAGFESIAFERHERAFIVTARRSGPAGGDVVG